MQKHRGLFHLRVYESAEGAPGLLHFKEKEHVIYHGNFISLCK